MRDVMYDLEQAVIEAAKALHKHIMYIGGPELMPDVDKRLCEAVEALQAAEGV